MAAVATVFVVVIVSLLISRVAAVALSLTGMSREIARFQARSALSGVGFTTSEAEKVVNHPVRRRIVMMLMIVGSAGIVTAVATLMLSFAGTSSSQAETRLLVLGGGLIALLLLSRSRQVDRWLSRLIAKGLRRWTDLETRDYAELLRLSRDHAVLEVAVREGDWFANQTLSDLDLRHEGIAVLGVERASGGYVAAPDWSTEIRPRDTLILYGSTEGICEADRRPRGPAGDAAHERAVQRHQSERGGALVRAGRT